MPTQNISATIEKKLLSKLDALAEETERNRSWIIGKAVESYLEDLEDLKIAKQRLKEPRLSPSGIKKLLRGRR
ncbi:MAG: ribbon-helix-helix protein, CopG family [Deltaproteobacteria bacterium]|nr:ribbon-helix-helix protein, CopG family [Deltaproteobacteria bacterium]